MDNSFLFSQFCNRFPDDETCLEEIKEQRFPDDTHCLKCKKITRYYKLKKRAAYSCKFCRHQIFPLANTIYEKSTTPLRLWFYAMFLMTHTRGTISARQLQRELGVTYKTAWRISRRLRLLMEQHNGDLLIDTVEKVHKWVFFNKFEIKLVQKQGVEESGSKT